MANEVDYLPFATGVGANVVNQATYAAAPWVSSGFETGLAESQELNKVWRQASMVAAAIANFVSNQLNIAVLDDGDLTNLITEFTAAVTGVLPGRIVTASTTLTLLSTDYAIGLNRTSGPAAMTANLPTSGLYVNQEFRIDDLSGNAAAYPITVAPPGGHTICDLDTFVMNVNRQSAIFHYYGSDIWGVK